MMSFQDGVWSVFRLSLFVLLPIAVVMEHELLMPSALVLATLMVTDRLRDRGY